MEAHDRPSKFSSVLVITYGRSGSTLLMGMLNAIDGYLIRGENRNCFYSLFEFWSTIHQPLVSGPHSRDPTSPFYNSEIVEDSIVDVLAKTARTYLIGRNSPRVYGFKEGYNDRLRQSGKEHVVAYLDFLQRIFPRCCLILNTRNLDDTMKSAKKNLKKRSFVGWRAYRKSMLELEDLMRTYALRHPENAFQITYENVTALDDKFWQMIDFLGEDCDEKRFRDVLEKRHSYHRVPLLSQLKIFSHNKMSS